MNLFNFICKCFIVLSFLVVNIYATNKELEDFHIGQCQIDSYIGFELQPNGPVASENIRFLDKVDFDTCAEICCNATVDFKCDLAISVNFTKKCLLVQCDFMGDILDGPCGFTPDQDLEDEELLTIVIGQTSSLIYINKRNTPEDKKKEKPNDKKNNFKENDILDLENKNAENKETDVSSKIGTNSSTDNSDLNLVNDILNITTTTYYPTQFTETTKLFTSEPNTITDPIPPAQNTTLVQKNNTSINISTTPSLNTDAMTVTYSNTSSVEITQNYPILNTTVTTPNPTVSSNLTETNATIQSITTLQQSSLLINTTVSSLTNKTEPKPNATVNATNTNITEYITATVLGSGLNEITTGNVSTTTTVFSLNDTTTSLTTTTSTTVTTPVITTTKGVQIIPVKVKGITSIRLPNNSVTLTGIAKQTPPNKEELQYKWQLLKSPKDQDAAWSGMEESVIELSDLTAGVYEFKVTVTGPTSKGLAYVNVTVLEPVRINKPPVAIITPAHQVIDLPTDTTILDGKKSTDDVEIVKYHWVALKGPLQNDYETSFEDGKNIARLTNLVEGSYTFQLTVTDNDGATNSTTATIQVKPKVDNPPIANAGPNQVIHLPQNSLVLCGNGSTDDWGIVGYKWSISQESGTQVADMQGARSKCLKLSNLEAGEYSFQLTVTDDSGQEDTTKVTVIVQPKSNSPPKADAGPDQQILQQLDGDLVATTLDGSKSSDDKGIARVVWTQTSGSPVTIVEPNSLATSVSGFSDVGVFEFKLTVTDDDEESGSDTMQVVIKEEQPPIVRAGEDITLRLPDNLAILDGSKSTDDYGIKSYKWTKSPKSPAAGFIINGTDDKAVLIVDGLIAGTYTFTLTVTNVRSKSSTDSVSVKVLPDFQLNGLVELYLNIDGSKFNEETKLVVMNKLNVILSLKADDKIRLRSVFNDHISGNVVMLFYVELANHTALPSLQVVEKINSQLKTNINLFDVKIARVDTYVCENKCSEHGRCHTGSKECECDTFWMENFFRKYVGDGNSNCDWSVLYVVIITIILIVATFVLIYTMTCCILRRKGKKRTTGRKRRGYATIPKSEYENLLLKSEKNGFKKSNDGSARTNTSNMHKTSSLMRSMTSSSDESTVFEKTHLITNHPPKRRSKPTKKRRKEASLIDVDAPDSNSDDGNFNGMGLDSNRQGHASHAV